MSFFLVFFFTLKSLSTSTSTSKPQSEKKKKKTNSHLALPGPRLAPPVLRLDRPHRPARGPHHHALRPSSPPPFEPHAAQEVAVGHARRREKDVVAAAEVVGVEDARKVVAQSQRFLALAVLLARREPPLDRAPQALERRCGDDPLWRAPHAQHHVDGRAGARRLYRAGDVAVGDEADARARRADLPDELGVPRPVENADLVAFGCCCFGVFFCVRGKKLSVSCAKVSFSTSADKGGKKLWLSTVTSLTGFDRASAIEARF